MKTKTWSLAVLVGLVVTFGMVVSLSAESKTPAERFISGTATPPKVEQQDVFKLVHLDREKSHSHYFGVTTQTQFNSSHRMSSGGIQIRF